MTTLHLPALHRRLPGFIRGCLLAIAVVAAFAAERPNVVLIVADDLRVQLGCYGDTVVKTPHLDAFARDALRFDRAYVQIAICSPSRNSFLSGLRPATTGLRGFGLDLRCQGYVLRQADLGAAQETNR